MNLIAIVFLGLTCCPVQIIFGLTWIEEDAIYIEGNIGLIHQLTEYLSFDIHCSHKPPVLFNIEIHLYQF
jgi:hypothetical protein